MSATCNVVDLAQYQDPNKIDWQGFVDAGVKAVIIQLSHGTSYEPYAREHIAKANQYGIIVHGYHYYEGTVGEVDFSISNANSIGLPKSSYLFLDFEEKDIQGDWQAQSFDFFNAWKSAGWNAGLYTGNSLYQSKFNNDVLVANGIYRWIAQYGSNSGSPELNWEPANYDIWQYASVGGIGSYGSDLDKSYDRTGKLLTKSTTPPPIVIDPHEPPKPTGGAYVGTGIDTTGFNGGKGLGYSTNGHDFYLALSPYGFIFRQIDADRMWELIKNKVGSGIKGDKGDAGPQGVKGDIGLTGPKGDTGPQGPPGSDVSNAITKDLINLEINPNATFDTPFIDFHTKTGGANDYDARVIVTGGKSGKIGQANLNMICGQVLANGQPIATTNQLGQLIQTVKGTAATNFELEGAANAYVYQLAPGLKLVNINAGINPKNGVSIPSWSTSTLINWDSPLPAYSSAISDVVYILGNTTVIAGNFQTSSFGVVNGSVKIDGGSGHMKINVAYLSKT